MQHIVCGGGEEITGEAEGYVYGDNAPYDIQSRSILLEFLKEEKSPSKTDIFEKLPGLVCINAKNYNDMVKQLKKLTRAATPQSEAQRLINYYGMWDAIESQLEIIRLKIGRDSGKRTWAQIFKSPEWLPNITINQIKRPLSYKFNGPKRRHLKTPLDHARYLMDIHETLEKYLNDFEIYTSRVLQQVKKINKAL
jgi:hypothetical protein